MKSAKQTIKLCGAMIAMAFFVSPTTAQTNYKFGTSSGVGGASDSGYTVGNQKVTFTNASTNSLASTNITVSLSNQQYGNGTTHPFEGLTNALYSGAVAFGAGINTVDTIPGAQLRYATLGTFGNPASDRFTANISAAPGTGIPSTTNALGLAVLTDALIDSVSGENYNGAGDLNIDIRFADITLTFNEPVSNPVIHLGGLGGNSHYNSDADLNKSYWLAWAPIFELQSSYAITRLSGDNTFDINGSLKRAKDNATWIGLGSAGSCFGGQTTYGASGSFAVKGVNITSLTFRIYLRSDSGHVTNRDSVVGSNSCGPYTNYAFTATSYPRWAYKNLVSADAFTLSVSFARVKITGNVFNDPDGNNVNNSTGSTNVIPSGLFVNLIDTTTGKVLKSIPVPTNGVFDFGDQNANGYRVALSNTLGVVGSLPPAFTPPAGWVATGTFNGTPNTGNSGNTNGVSQLFASTEAANTGNINFGIQQLPASDSHTTVIPQPNVNDTIALNGVGTNPPSLSGSDVQDGTYTGSTGTVRNPSGVIITTLPTNGILYYGGNPVAVGDTIINPSLLTIVLTGTGYLNVEFEYAYIDAAGFADPTPAVYNINWSTPLPVMLMSFEALKNNNTTLLKWATASEQNNKGFAIERSNDGTGWNNIGFVSSLSTDGNSNILLSYTFVDNSPLPNTNYYRLKQTNFNGKYEYSPVRLVIFDKTENNVVISPNPVRNQLQIQGLTGKSNIITITNTTGQTLIKITANNTTSQTIDMSQLSNGIYFITVTNESGFISNHKIAKV